MKKLILIILFFLTPSISHADIWSGLIALWKFNEASSGTCSSTTPDASNNSNLGTCVNSPTFTTGRLGLGSMTLNGTNQYVWNSGSNNNVMGLSNAAQNLSFSEWVKITSQPSNTILQNIFFLVIKNTGVTSRRIWRIYYTNTSGVFGITLDNRGSFNVTLSNNVWYHIVFTTNSSSNNIVYINGIQVYTNTADETASTAAGDSNDFTVGASNYSGIVSGNDPLPGVVDDVRVYNRTLSASDVAQLYQYGVVVLNNFKLQ